jgi:hypothetical protein
MTLQRRSHTPCAALLRATNRKHGRPASSPAPGITSHAADRGTRRRLPLPGPPQLPRARRQDRRERHLHCHGHGGERDPDPLAQVQPLPPRPQRRSIWLRRGARNVHSSVVSLCRRRGAGVRGGRALLLLPWRRRPESRRRRGRRGRRRRRRGRAGNEDGSGEEGRQGSEDRGRAPPPRRHGRGGSIWLGLTSLAVCSTRTRDGVMSLWCVEAPDWCLPQPRRAVVCWWSARGTNGCR